MERGRPRKKIDIEQLEKCAEKQWSNTEIAAFFRVSVDTIERRFAGIVKKARERGTAKLRDLQWKRALEGSDRMILHMSKHYLNQQDKVEVTGKDGAAIAPTAQVVIALPNKDEDPKPSED